MASCRGLTGNLVSQGHPPESAPSSRNRWPAAPPRQSAAENRQARRITNPGFPNVRSDAPDPGLRRSGKGGRLSAALARGGCLQGGLGADMWLAAMVSGDAQAPAGRLGVYPLRDDPVHSGKRLLNLGPIGDIPRRELVSAQAAGQFSPELELPQADLERLPALRADQIDPRAPVILKQAQSSPSAPSRPPEAWQ